MIKTIYLIAGPTASGKSKFSIDLAKKNKWCCNKF
ncbi:MAG: isopentenyl transferase family protein [Alphaproteobacteria bacterium]